jgi:hypothetical protein
MIKKNKKFPTIGCCGIDCGLCPRYYTEGKSRCPGCYGHNFIKVMGQKCSFITCCAEKNKFEVCGECNEFPCKKFNTKWFGSDAFDSFVTHRKAVSNQYLVKEHNIGSFLKQQNKRIKLLEKMLNQYNEGRSKSFYCLSTALLSIEGIEQALGSARKKIKILEIKENDFKSKAKILKEALQEIANKEDIKLKLNKPPNWK